MKLSKDDINRLQIAVFNQIRAFDEAAQVNATEKAATEQKAIYTELFDKISEIDLQYRDALYAFITGLVWGVSIGMIIMLFINSLCK